MHGNFFNSIDSELENCTFTCLLDTNWPEIQSNTMQFIYAFKFLFRFVTHEHIEICLLGNLVYKVQIYFSVDDSVEHK